MNIQCQTVVPIRLIVASLSLSLLNNRVFILLRRSTFQYWGKRNGTYGGLEFITLEDIPANTQLCHWYGSGWWSARGMKRVNVGLGKYPAPKRIPKGKQTESQNTK